MTNNKNYGVIVEEPKPEDYIVGLKSPLVHGIKFPDGHGIMDYITRGEFQKKAFESSGCVSMSGNHNTQIVKKINHGIDENESDKFTIVGSGTTEQGNSLGNVAEFKRTKGFALEEEYPWPDNQDRESFFRNIPQATYDLAKKHKAVFEIKHEWIIVNPVNVIEILKTGCPIQATITDWEERDGINYSVGSDQIHAINIVDYQWNNYFWIYDQYNNDFTFDGNTDPKRFLKKFDWDFPFGHWGKKFTVIKAAETVPSFSLITKLKNMLKNLVAYMDEHGLHIWYLDTTRGRQEIPLTSDFEKALAMSFVKEKIIPTSSFGAIAGYPVVKFF